MTASEDHVNLGEASVTLNVLGTKGVPPELSQPSPACYFLFSMIPECFFSSRLLSWLLFTVSSSVPPHVPSCDVPSSVFVGSGLELHCKDQLSVPPATYRWYKDNRALTATADTPYVIDMKKGTLVRTHTQTFCTEPCSP